MSLEYRRFSLPLFDSVWVVWRNRQCIGYAVRQGRHWMAAAPTLEARFHVDEDGCPRWFRTRDDATMLLALVAEGMA
jgi:hypothetical protein